MSKPIVFIGQSGSGKSSAVKMIADRTKSAYVDLDVSLVEHSGREIPDIIRNDGEDKFRELETQELESALLSEFPILSAGGGLILSQTNRDMLRKDAFVIWLDTSVENLVERLSASHDRPLLIDGDDLLDNLRVQRSDRLKYYMLAADRRIDTDNKNVEDVVEEALRIIEDSSDGTEDYRTEMVNVSDGRSYPVLIGWDAASKLSELIPEGVNRVAVVTQDGIDIKVDSGVEQNVFAVEDGEVAKRLAVVESICSQFSNWGLKRKDMVVSVGGGVVTDLAGYCAASYHRGIKVAHVPTSLLAQIDAAIGGKCGVNLPEGKNLVGAFWQPESVLCDISTLQTLPAEEFRNGLGELAKYHFIKDSLVSLVEDFDGLDAAFNKLSLVELVAACVKIKATVVAEDEKESGLRMILNYGHTLAHALETFLDYQIRHGEAVALGLIYAAELAHEMERISADRVEEHYRIVKRYALKSRLPVGVEPNDIVELFSADKKAVDAITFVLDGPNGIEPVKVEDKKLLVKVCEKLL